MSLDLGELVGSLRMDVSPFDKALSHGDQALTTFASNAAADAKAAGDDIGRKLGDGATGALDNLMKVLPLTAKGAVDKTSAQFQALSPALKKAVNDAGAQVNFDKLPAEAKTAMMQAEAAIKAGGAGAADEADKAGEKAGSAFGDALKDKAKAGGAAAGVALGVGVVDNLSLEQGRLKLAAQLGLSVQDSARLGKVAGEVYADNWGENRDEINVAIAAVVSSIKGMRRASDAELGAATEMALAYADTFDIDVTRAVSSAGGLIQSGLAKNATQAFDLITAASSKVPAHLREDVLDATDEYGQFFHSLGYNGPQSFALLVKGAQKGMYGIDKAGDAVKEFTIRSTDMSTSSKGAYKSIGLNAREMANDILAGGDRAHGATQKIIKGILAIKDPAKQGQAAIALFGTPLEDLNTAQIPQFLKSLQGSGKEMKGWRGAAQDMADTAGGGTANSIETAKRRVIEWGRGVIQSTGPTTAMAGAIAAVGPAMLSIIGPVAQVIAARGAQSAAAATAATAETAAGTATVRSWLMAAAASTAGAVRMAASWLIAIGPIAIVIAAIAGVAYLVYKNWDTIKEYTGKAWSWVVNFVKDHALLLITVVTGPIGALVYLMIKHWDTIQDKTGQAWDWVVNKVKAVPRLLVSFFLNFTLPGLVIKHFDAMKDGAINKAQALVSWVSGLPGRILSKFASLGGDMKDRGTTMFIRMRSGAEDKAGDFLNWVSGVPGRILNKVGALSNLLTAPGRAALQSLLSGATDRAQAVYTWMSGLPERLKAKVGNVTTLLSGIGGDIIAGLKSGIDGAAHLVEDAVQAVINKIPKKIRKLMGISSPSKVMRDLARWIPAGIAAGFADGTEGVEKAVETLTDKIDATFDARAKRTEAKINAKYDRMEKRAKKGLKGDAESNALDRIGDARDKALKNAETRSGKAQKAILATLKEQLPALRANAREQDRISGLIATASEDLANWKQQAADYAASVKDSVVSFGSISSVLGSDDFTSIGDLIAKRRGAADQANQFAGVIDQLRGKLNDTDLQDLIARGPEALTVAKGILDGGGEAIQAMNDTQISLQNTGKTLGDNVAATLYTAGTISRQNLLDGLVGDLTDVQAKGTALGAALVLSTGGALVGFNDLGKNAKKGLLAGILANDDDIDKAAGKLSTKLVRAIKEKLGIRSPSTVFRGIGVNTVEGMILGLADQVPALERKMRDVTDVVANVDMPSLSSVVTASGSPSSIPESAEVAAYRASQAPQQNFNIYETTDPQATAAEVSRRQAFAGAGA